MSVATTVLTTLLVLTAVTFGTRWYLRSQFGRFSSTKKLDGYTAIVTGANTGIGKETAKDFASRGAKVILACRNEKRAEAARREIIDSTKNSNVHVKLIDLANFTSIREFAKDINATEKRLDILVNNAAAAGLKPEKTVDGLETMIQINHYGPFYLTNLLLPILKRSEPSRIVFLSSIAHRWAKPDFKNMDTNYTGMQNYCVSKLFNAITTRGFAKRLAGTRITVNSVHPGAVDSDLYREIPTEVLRKIVSFFMRFFQKSPAEGAETVVHAAIADQLEGVSGKYFSECKEEEVSKDASNPEYEEILWKHSEKVVNLTFKVPT